MTERAEPAGGNIFFCARYINIGTGGADLSLSFFLPELVGRGRAAEMCMTKATAAGAKDPG